ncbi:MAG: zinc ribbon domain-containing protein [Gemmatimonadaceae bacterium]
MDDLDRLFRRAVHNVRAAYPELLTQPFEISQLYQQVVPYRLNRRELGVETVEDYEVALMRLISGERGYLTGDAEMQVSLREELESSNPDTSAYRAYATSRIAIAADAVRAADKQPVHRVAAASPAPASAAAGSAAMAARATQPVQAEESAAPADRASPSPPSRQSPAQSTSAKAAGEAGEPVPRASLGGAAVAPQGEVCRYCSGELPAGRSVTFCPYCGHDLTVQRCPACNTELDVGWRFCVSCGRQVA